MKYKRYVILLIFVGLFPFRLFGETVETDTDTVPHIFHNIGWNFLYSFAYNYGANFVAAGAGTWGIIESGLDWKWRNTVFDNYWLSSGIGRPVMTIGGVVPAFTPLIFYLSGRYFDDTRLLIAASALTQTLILTLAIQSPLKMITGQKDPGLVNNRYYERTSGADDFSGIFNWFNMDFINGWPSGHTANAFSAAAAISEIYYDKFWVKAAAYTYAAFIGFGVTTYAHWASEAFAGALIGYAIGKTVGKSYRKFLNNNADTGSVSLYATTRSLGVVIHL